MSRTYRNRCLQVCYFSDWVLIEHRTRTCSYFHALVSLDGDEYKKLLNKYSRDGGFKMSKPGRFFRKIHDTRPIRNQWRNDASKLMLDIEHDYDTTSKKKLPYWD